MPVDRQALFAAIGAVVELPELPDVEEDYILSLFDDSNKLRAADRATVAELVYLDMISGTIEAKTGKCYLAPNKILTRAESAALIYSAKYPQSGTIEFPAGGRYTHDSLLDTIALNVPIGLTDIDKVVAVSDYLVIWSQYAFESDGVTPDHNYANADSILFYGKGICEAYASAFNNIMEKLGIESILVSSDELNHAWNMVKLNGIWYHCDVTWNDPPPDKPGRAVHKYLLLSEATIRDAEHKHYGAFKQSNGKAVPSATDTQYENYYWMLSEKPIDFTLDYRIAHWEYENSPIDVWLSGAIARGDDYVGLARYKYRIDDFNVYWRGEFKQKYPQYSDVTYLYYHDGDYITGIRLVFDSQG
jgi:hypothetical protein